MRILISRAAIAAFAVVVWPFALVPVAFAAAMIGTVAGMDVSPVIGNIAAAPLALIAAHHIVREIG